MKLAEKQRGAAGSEPAGVAAVTLWQMVQATFLFPEVLWENEPAPCQSVGCALAVGWQAAQEVEASPPLKRIVPGVPWQV